MRQDPWTSYGETVDDSFKRCARVFNAKKTVFQGLMHDPLTKWLYLISW